MESLTLSAFVIAGSILYLLFELNKAYTKEGFTWKLFIRNHMWSTVLNMACGITCVFAREDMHTTFGFEVSKLGAVILGLAGQKVFASVIEFFNSKIKTKIGANDGN